MESGVSHGFLSRAYRDLSTNQKFYSETTNAPRADADVDTRLELISA
jgi:hypothetical protein